MEYYIGNQDRDSRFFCHHGVKGMKWGVRKKPVSSGKSIAKKSILDKLNPFAKKETVVQQKPAKSGSDIKKAFSGDKKDISKASDEELNAYLKRMQLEKQVLAMQKEMTALTTPSAPVVQKKASVGKRFVSAVWKDILYPGIKEGMKEAGKSAVKSMVDDMIKKAMEKKAAGS